MYHFLWWLVKTLTAHKIILSRFINVSALLPVLLF
ncbi:hypothetical protein COPEUT_02307 [Coprococcus eutactus ATCC 27759]|nr:hypothetical protein COPEUT_02307 [Coprococcus eutactus ATCC 27759]